MLRVVLVGISIIISYVFQTTFSSGISFGVAAPNIIMAFVCSYALLRGKKEGMYVGFILGILVDLFYGYYDVIGINAFLYMIIGFVIGMFHEIFYLEDILIPMAVVGVCDFLYNFIYYVITFLLRNKLDFIYYIKAIILPEMVYTIFITVFIYRLLMYFNKKLEAFEKRGEKELD
ncbi:MAG: rod shape-determining protein MreD [Lachnospiraceae bacterium]|nr:rod shape-determining protein MreD [Lachnospiraceae bacterium]